MSFKPLIIPLHIQYSHIYTWHNPLAFLLPLPTPPCSPLVSPSTYLAPSSCDRNRPPQSQVACKLTPFAPPFTQPTPSLPKSQSPTAQRLTTTTSGIFRLLLSRTSIDRQSFWQKNFRANYEHFRNWTKHNFMYFFYTPTECIKIFLSF